jgi:hypothetical protein
LVIDPPDHGWVAESFFTPCTLPGSLLEAVTEATKKRGGWRCNFAFTRSFESCAVSAPPVTRETNLARDEIN